MARREPKNQHMPQFGEFIAGPFTGWRFAFLRFVHVDGELYLDLRCTPPAWPFPQDVRFSMTKDRFTLRAVPGERAPRLDALMLMAIATRNGYATSPLGDND
jgi:hypothetical protein